MSTVRNRDGGTDRSTRSTNVRDRVPTAAWPLDFEHLEASYDGAPDLVCFSHLRWNFVYQRPQHLMSRCARRRRVFFVEEPIFDANIAASNSRLDLTMSPSGVCIVVPHLSTSVTKEVEATTVLRDLVDGLFQQCGIHDCVLWYYTPMAMTYTRHIPSLAVVYDCMDE